MKTLILLRHAKSDHSPALSDRDRPLAERGTLDAPRMGQRLHARAVRLDKLISSPAVRALATARLMAAALEYPPRRILVDERLYPGDVAQLLAVIRTLDEEAHHVMLVAHNPGLSELAHRFAAQITHLPTCAAAAFEFDGAWSDITGVDFSRVTLETPKGS
ncbi:MAG: histidine phosphatase family protein [Gammaproteobacteria bacterium]|nr:histidine phosphatase family protein [Gammaproteobacteria bacterium]